MAKNAYINGKIKRCGKVSDSACVILSSPRACADAYLASLKLRKYSPETLSSKSGRLRIFLKFLEERKIRKIQEVDRNMLSQYRAYLRGRGTALSTFAGCFGDVKLLFSFMEKEGVIFINPASGIKIPRAESIPGFVPSPEEVFRFLESVDTGTPTGLRDRAMLETAYSAGLRFRELLSLTVSCADLKNSLVRIFGKGARERLLPLGGHAVFYIEKYLKYSRPYLLGGKPDEHYMWISKGGNSLKCRTLYGLVKEYRDAAGIEELTVHSLRRAFATHMLANGASIEALRLMLGHSTFKTLKKYLKYNISEIQATHSGSIPGR